jgi:hypothetical protein
MNTLPEALTPEVLAGHVERITSYNAAVAERHLGSHHGVDVRLIAR